MLVLVKNKTEAKKEINNFVSLIGDNDYDFEEINLDVKYPFFLIMTSFDFNGVGRISGIHAIIHKFPLTKKIKKAVVETML